MKIAGFKRTMTLSAGILLLGLLIGCTSGETKLEEEIDVLTYVDPFIGTGFHGHTFPGPVLPNGMIQLSPDTRLNGWDASSGYHYSDDTIYGFSHTHLSGTGIGDLGDILLLPFTGEPKEKPVAKFLKVNEKAEVGYYAVKFDNYAVEAKLTATTRVGMHQYHYESKESKKLLLDVGHILQRTWGHDNTYNELEIINDQTIRGIKQSSGWAFDHKVYFYIKFSSPFVLESVFTDDKESDNSAIYKGKDIYAYFGFDALSEQEALQIKVSVSSVDPEGAVKNMKQELPGWDFEEVKEKAKDSWRMALKKIDIETRDKEKQTIFYTALYHSMIAPMIFQDVDGRYRGMDQEIHSTSEGETNYTVYSLWDTFRALHPLMTIIDEKKSADWVNNLLQKYKEGGLLPMWPLAANYTGTMVGYPAVANIADALNKEIPGIDKKLALEAAINSASYKPWLVENSDNLRKKSLMPLYNKYVNENRHIPADKIIKSVSFGLEMAYYDWCIAEIAKLNGNDSIVRVFEERALNYKRYFDVETGFMRGKNEDGSWVTPFNAKYSSHDRSDYVEGNAWQWTWFVPHDIDGFKDLYGSDSAFVQKLDTLFSTSSEILGEDASGDITGLIGQYAHGNEPSHHITYLYSYAGKSWKTAELIDQILNDFYAADPEGIIGNEDCGQMSAWYIMNAMGFYQMTPGRPVYTIGRPLFDKVDINLETGKVFTIIAENNSEANKYVQEVWLNGIRHERLFFTHFDIKNGGTLKIIMGDEANKKWN